jgi:hypothetical protein
MEMQFSSMKQSHALYFQGKGQLKHGAYYSTPFNDEVVLS